MFAGPGAPIRSSSSLFAFFSFLGDRNFSTHTSQRPTRAKETSLFNGAAAGAGATYATAGSKSANPAMPSFAGFTAGTKSSAAGYACRTDAPQNALAAGQFNVLSFVIEVPRTLLTTGFNSSVIHVWATANSSTGS